MEGLKDNFVNISQIYDNKYTIKFTQNDCAMYVDYGNTIVRGIISKGNFYCVGTPLEVMCNRLNLSTEEHWHQQFSHINNKLLNKISSLKIVKALQNISSLLKHVCGPC